MSTSKAPKEWAMKYRGATIADLDPPTALSLSPTSPISTALSTSFERDYTHLTITSSTTRSLLGYLSIPHLRTLLASGTVTEDDPISKAMQRFRRKGEAYQIITMDTPLEELELFFYGEDGEGGEVKQRFAVVTDGERKFVLGVATVEDLKRFVGGRVR